MLRLQTLLMSLLTILMLTSCIDRQQQKSDSGVTKASTKVKTNMDGLTIEQQNIIERLKRDNDVGSLKHLYIISSYTGDVLQYSTVKGKVTSGGKRLSPRTVSSGSGTTNGNYVQIGGQDYSTDEVLDDGGAYGDSGNYLFWFDAQDNYHQYYPSGGTYLEISDKPMRIKKTNFSIEIEK